VPQKRFAHGWWSGSSGRVPNLAEFKPQYCQKKKKKKAKRKTKILPK
jgi:hypothetical protein